LRRVRAAQDHSAHPLQPEIRPEKDADTLQAANAHARKSGLIPHCIASYGTAAEPRFAAIFAPNPGRIVWNADGVLESPGDYQARFGAQGAGWCRVAFVTLNQQDRYVSLFCDDRIGPVIARHNLASGDLESEAAKYIAQGFYPSCLQASGPVAKSARFAAIFVKGEKSVAKMWRAEGPGAVPRSTR